MNELSNEELDQLLENAMEAMFILQEERPGDETLFPKEEDYSRLDQEPETSHIVESLILEVLLCNEFERAKTYLQKALTLQPANPVFLLYQALVHYVTERNRTSAISLARSIDIFALVCCEEKNEIIAAFIPGEDYPIDFPSVIDYSVLDSNTDFTTSVRKVCMNIQLFSLVRNYHRAIDCFQQLFTLIGESPKLLLELAIIYNFTKQHREAKKCLKKALLVEPQLIVVIYALAETHRSLQEYEQAIGFYRKYLSHKPTDLTGLIPLALCYESLNHTEIAVDILEKVIVINPQIENSGWQLIPEMDKLIRIVQEKRIAQL